MDRDRPEDGWPEGPPMTPGQALAMGVKLVLALAIVVWAVEWALG